MLRITKRGSLDAQQKSLSFERFTTLGNHQLRLKTDEIGVLILFRGKLKYRDYRNKEECTQLDSNSGIMFNYFSALDIVACDSESDGLTLKLNVRCLQKILSEIKYKADLKRFVDEPLNSISLPQVEEINILFNSFDLYSNRLAFYSSELLYESKLLELLWLINDHSKVNFDRFVHQYLIPDRTYLNAIMNEHYRENLSLNQLATLAGYSISTFKRKFSDAYQSSPKRWIQNKRLQEAKSLLEFSDKTISEVGYELGFENISHFIHSFKLKFGITPKNLQDKYSRERIVRIAS